MASADTIFWLAWSYILRGRQLKKLFDYFQNGEEAWRASSSALTGLGFQPETLKKIDEERQRLNPKQKMEELQKRDLKMTLFKDENYPPLLSQIYDAPALLFYRGRLPDDKEISLAIVGTRSVSRYGQAATITITRELAADGLNIVSGLARGIDALAHETALEVGGRTTAVLGSGLNADDIYPREHLKLTRQITESGGCIISEYPPGVGPEKHHFPERNRIIAGLTAGTLVIEAPETSGALITAKLALEYNREVMAVPGNIFEKNSLGANNLIKLGAKVVSGADDVREALQIQVATGQQNERVFALSPEESHILKALSKNPLHIDNLIKIAEVDSASLGSLLTILELKGAAKDVGGKYYIRL